VQGLDEWKLLSFVVLRGKGNGLAGGKLRDFYELFSCGRWLHLIQGWV
jgi:hypothetical protein